MGNSAWLFPVEFNFSASGSARPAQSRSRIGNCQYRTWAC